MSSNLTLGTGCDTLASSVVGRLRKVRGEHLYSSRSGPEPRRGSNPLPPTSEPLLLGYLRQRKHPRRPLVRFFLFGSFGQSEGSLALNQSMRVRIPQDPHCRAEGKLGYLTWMQERVESPLRVPHLVRQIWPHRLMVGPQTFNLCAPDRYRLGSPSVLSSTVERRLETPEAEGSTPSGRAAVLL